MDEVKEAKDFLMDKHSIKMVQTYRSFMLYLKIYNNKIRQAKRFLKQFIQLINVKNIEADCKIGILNYFETCSIIYLSVSDKEGDIIKIVSSVAHSLFDLIGEKYDDSSS
jgi:hypothetical protein